VLRDDTSMTQDKFYTWSQLHHVIKTHSFASSRTSY